MPDALISVQEYSTLLDERYREVVEFILASQKDVRGMIFKMGGMDRRTERKTSIGEYPNIPEFTGQVPYARPYEGYTVEATARTWVAGLRITQDMLEDDLSGIMNGDMFQPMIRASVVTQNKHATWPYNFADSVDTYWYTRSEGLPLASNAHTTRVPGVSTAAGFDNLILDVFSPTTYRAGRIQFRQFRSDVGDLIDEEPDELWLPTDQTPRGMEVLQSARYPDDARNAINPEQGTATLNTLIHWNTTENWAISNKRMREANWEWLDYIPIDYFRIREFDTFQAKWALRGRWTQRIFDWRSHLWALPQ